MYYLLELMQQCRDDAVQGVIADYVSAEPPMIPALVVRPSLSLHTYSLSACRQCVVVRPSLSLHTYSLSARRQCVVVRPSLSLHTYSLSACRQCVQLDLILTLTAYADVF